MARLINDINAMLKIVESKSVFEKAGMLYIPAFFNELQLASYMEEMKSFCNKQNDYISIKPRYNYHRLSGSIQKEPTLFSIENFIEQTPSIRSISNHENLVCLLTELLSDKPILFYDKLSFKESKSTAVGAHQDAVWFGWGLFANPIVTVLIALEKSTLENGCFQFSKGSHKRGRMGSYCRKNVDLDLEYEPVEMNPGDVVLFDSYLVHQSGFNFSDYSRKCILLSFKGARSGNNRENYFLYFPQLVRRMLLKRLQKNASDK